MENLPNVRTILTAVNGWIRLFTFLWILVIHSEVQSQTFLPFEMNGKSYCAFKDADSLFNLGEYAQSCKRFSEMDDMIRLFPTQQYRHALALYLTGDSTEARRVFYQALKSGLKFYSLSNLENSPLVKELCMNPTIYAQSQSTCYTDSLAIFKKEMETLTILRFRDQLYRGPGIHDPDSLNIADSLNRIELSLLIRRIGWPGIREVGYSGENSAFLIAQHADNDIRFQLNCLQLMESEFMEHNITLNQYAMIIDRYMINSKGYQLFGTQLMFHPETKKFEMKPCLYPLEVNTLRTLFDLGSVEDYILLMNKRYQ